MSREFEIYSKPSFPNVAVKRGFSWPGFFFSWIWALSRGLWMPAALIVGFGVLLITLQSVFSSVIPVTFDFSGLIIMVIVGLRGNNWRCRKLERDGYEFTGLVEARSPASAVAAHALGKKSETGKTSASVSFLSLPSWSRGIVAVAGLTWKAAIRFRLFMVIAALLIIAVVGLPILLKDDGTARGFTQILLTYTLGAITALLGFSTLWLSCGTLARDIEECQMQVVATKPIARWQIWLGKWIGILSLNAALLALAGACVFGLLQWRARELPFKEQAILRNEVLVARGSAKPADVENEIESQARDALKERLKRNPVTSADLPEVEKQIIEQIKAEYQLVPPGYGKTWTIDFGTKAKSVQDQPLQLRIKFNAANKVTGAMYGGMWVAGVPGKTKIWQIQEPSMPPDTYNEFQIDPGLLDDKGVLTISFLNPNDAALLFPLEDGIEVLYREGSFGLNFIRGLGIIFCWMALFAAIGLASASFLSFPVAAFLSLAILTMALSSGTMANAVEDGTVDSTSGATAKPLVIAINAVTIPVFRGALKVINLAKDFSPIDSLSTGRSITWTQLGKAFGQIVLLLGGIFAVFGIFVFSRRELATAQNQQ